MKRLLIVLIITCFFSIATLASEEIIWADKVIEFSSQYGTESWSTEKVLGEPDTYPNYGDYTTTWAPSSKNSGTEFIEVGFPQATRASGIRIYETYNPGAITEILARDENGKLNSLWNGVPESKGTEAVILEYDFNVTYKIASIRIIMDTSAVAGWNEIDAIGIIPAPEDLEYTTKKVIITPVEEGKELWAVEVADFSSQYGSESWSAEKALGEHDVYPEYGDYTRTWTPSSKNAGDEFIEVKFSEIHQAIGFKIYETYNPGAISRVLARDENGQLHILWEGRAEPKETESTIFSFGFEKTPFRVVSLRIELKTDKVPGWNEIDAIALLPSPEEDDFVDEIIVTPEENGLPPVLISTVDRYAIPGTYYYYIGPIVLKENAGPFYERLRIEANVSSGKKLELWLMSDSQFRNFADGSAPRYLGAFTLNSLGEILCGFGLENDETYYVVFDNTRFGLIESPGEVTFTTKIWGE